MTEPKINSAPTSKTVVCAFSLAPEHLEWIKEQGGATLRKSASMVVRELIEEAMKRKAEEAAKDKAN